MTGRTLPPAPVHHCAAEHSLSHGSAQHGLFLLPVQHLALLSKMLPHSYDSSLRLQDVSSPTGCATAEQLGESSVPAPLAPNAVLCMQLCPVGHLAQQNPQWEGFPMPSLPPAAAEGSACSVPASQGLASEDGWREIGCRAASVCLLSAVSAQQGIAAKSCIAAGVSQPLPAKCGRDLA